MEGLCAGPLVRAVGPAGVAIWTEWSFPCEVTLKVAPTCGDEQTEGLTVQGRTVAVGGRYYALSVLTGLQPATWYHYSLNFVGEQGASVVSCGETFLQCFRTLDSPAAGNSLRLAYGSCRRLSVLEADALNAFGFWLRACQHQRETRWPHLLLLIGDQIYADDPLGSQAHTFEEFAGRYVKAWNGDEGVRQLLAVLPTYMIFDDHEITNNWNIVPSWQARVLQNGLEQMLVDGLVAYWIYQGWGNVALQESSEDDLAALMRQAEQNGEDALEALRARVRRSISGEKALRWDYTLPTQPPIFVADARADRTVVVPQQRSAGGSPRIMSQAQMARLHAWAQAHTNSTLVLVSSVPVLLPPAIGLAEYIVGLRPPQRLAVGPLRRLARLLVAGEESVVRRMGFEHWPAFHATWHELVACVVAHQRDVCVLSGDVHFSYAITARGKGRAVLHQLVASPFRNLLGRPDKLLILAQAWIKWTIYGGLRLRMLPLLRAKGERRIPSGILRQNVVALVTYSPQSETEGKYEIQQIYMGIVEQSFRQVGATPPL